MYKSIHQTAEGGITCWLGLESSVVWTLDVTLVEAVDENDGFHFIEVLRLVVKP